MFGIPNTIVLRVYADVYMYTTKISCGIRDEDFFARVELFFGTKLNFFFSYVGWFCNAGVMCGRVYGVIDLIVLMLEGDYIMHATLRYDL